MARSSARPGPQSGRAAVAQRFAGTSRGISGSLLSTCERGARFRRRAGRDDADAEVVLAVAAAAGFALREARPVLRRSCRSPSIKLSLAHASQTSTGTRRSWPVPIERPAAARRYSWALAFEQPTAQATSAALTHGVMPAGSRRPGVRTPRARAPYCSGATDGWTLAQ